MIEDSLYIVCEGPDGSGKSTMAYRLTELVRDHTPKGNVMVTRHPGSTPLGAALREIIKHRDDIPVDPHTELLLFVCDMSSFAHSILRPCLENGKVMIADRSNIIGSYAYQLASGVPIEQLNQIHAMLDIPQMDVLLIYDLPWSAAKPRVSAREDRKCRIEERGDEYFERVIDNYRAMLPGGENHELIKRYAKKIIRIDADQPLEDVWDATKCALEYLL